MIKLSFLIVTLFLAVSVCFGAYNKFETDVIKTSGGDLEITFIGHGTLMFAFDGKVIHVDPWSRLADYEKMTKADIILVTHEHGDHLDVKAIGLLRADKTKLVTNKACEEKIDGCIVMKNGDSKVIGGLKVKAVPAYNIVHKRESGSPFHPKGTGNGYVVTFGDKRVYVAGDTENIPEMENLDDIDVTESDKTIDGKFVYIPIKNYKPSGLLGWDLDNVYNKANWYKGILSVEAIVKNLD